MNTFPLLSVGTFGVHVIADPGGSSYSFVGTVPVGINPCGYKTLDEAINAFVAWFRVQDLDFQREHVGNLRSDVFACFLSSSVRLTF